MEEKDFKLDAQGIANLVNEEVNSKDAYKRRLHNEMCDYSDHLKFHSDGYKVPEMFYNRYTNMANAGQLLTSWMPDLNNWQFDDPEKNIWFSRLILSRRPSEDLTIMFYRAMQYKPITKTPISKVVNTLRKIEKANDFRVDWSKSEVPASLSKENSLEVYCEEKFPGYGSVQNYVFSYLLREVIARDPNLLIGIRPDDEYQAAANELTKPYIYIFNIEMQVYFKDGDIAIIRCDEKHYYNDVNGTAREGNKFQVWTKNEIWEVKQNDKNFFVDEPPYVHNLGELPIWRPRGNVKKNKGFTPINNSFIDDMLPSLDNAAGEFSDLQAEVVQHIYSTMWYYEGQNCTICNGSGSVQKNGNKVECSKCKGEGVMPKSPFKDLVIRPAKKNLGEQDTPTPPAGFVEKDVTIVELQDKRIQNHFINALDAVSMRYLAEAPTNQSGIAKRYDYEETFSFIYPVGRFIVESILRKIYYFINKYRYGSLFSEEVLLKMLPSIAIPAQFEVMTEQMIAEEVKSLREGKIDPIIVSEKEMDYAYKAFRDDKVKLSKIYLSKELNPFPSMSYQEILDSELAGTITKPDAVKATYLPYFLEMAYQENKQFYELDHEDQVKIIDSMVEAKVKELTATNAKTIIRANIDTASNTQGS